MTAYSSTGSQIQLLGSQSVFDVSHSRQQVYLPVAKLSDGRNILQQIPQQQWYDNTVYVVDRPVIIQNVLPQIQGEAEIRQSDFVIPETQPTPEPATSLPSSQPDCESEQVIISSEQESIQNESQKKNSWTKDEAHAKAEHSSRDSGSSRVGGTTNREKLEDSISDDGQKGKGCCKYGPKQWCFKYFWEGQSVSPSASADGSWFSRNRRVVALLLPAFIFHIFWWALAAKYSLWHLFPEKYYMTLCMIAGSIVAGMTSEGGGAIAFPVMTLAFQISPIVARDFSLMIQSCGMSAAAASIFMMRIRLEWHSLTLCSAGGAMGIVIGLYGIDPYLSPPQKKMGFVSIWFSFAFALFLLNRIHKRQTFPSIPQFCAWKGLVLFVTGIVGGMFSSFAGSGLDICSFSMLTLLFRVSEKVATPTSVVLMAVNTVVGFYWRGVMSADPISQEAWDFLAVCVPVVVLGAPLGSVLGSHFHRQVLAALVYIIDVAALVGAFVLVPLTPALLGASIGIVVTGFVFFMLITYAGHRLLQRIVNPKEKSKDSKA